MGVILNHALPIIHRLWKSLYATSEITTSTISRSYASQPVGNRGTRCYYFLLRRIVNHIQSQCPSFLIRKRSRESPAALSVADGVSVQQVYAYSSILQPTGHLPT